MTPHLSPRTTHMLLRVLPNCAFELISHPLRTAVFADRNSHPTEFLHRSSRHRYLKPSQPSGQ
jgi:hypothetical protein